MNFLTKEQILATNDREQIVEDVPEWNGAVIIGTLTGKQRDKIESEVINAKDKNKTDNFRVKLLAKCLIDEAGNRLFTDDEIEALSAKNAKILHRLFEKALSLNAIGQKEVEDLTKN